MFWNILAISSLVGICILVVCTLFGLVCVFTNSIFDIDLLDRLERNHPKTSKFIGKAISLVIAFTLLTFGTCAVHMGIEDFNKEHTYTVVVGEDDIKITDQNGKTYTLIFQD